MLSPSLLNILCILSIKEKNNKPKTSPIIVNNEVNVIFLWMILSENPVMESHCAEYIKISNNSVMSEAPEPSVDKA